MNKNKLDNLVDILSNNYDEVQNTLSFLSFAYLLRNNKDNEWWATKQRDSLKAFRNKLEKIADEKLVELNNLHRKVLVLMLASVNKDLIKINDETKEIIVKDSKIIDDKMREVEMHNKIMVNALVQSVFQRHVENINVIEYNKTDGLFKAITNVIDKTGVENAPAVVYRNGRVVSWKSYMEMNVRTTVNQEIVDYQTRTGAESGVVFWLCSSHGDCADDHRDYQGKLYYDDSYTMMNLDERVKNKITAFIKNRGLMSIQKVKNEKPYLTTRPNCRHYFQPVSIEDALNVSVKSLLNDLGMNKGKYDEEKYNMLKQQRYNERQIRKWKSEVKKYEMENIANPNDENVIKKLNIAKERVSLGQAKQRKLIKDNPYLERDLDRESNNILKNDLGYRFKHIDNN